MGKLRAGQLPQQEVCDAITAFVQVWDEDAVYAICMGVPSRSCGYNEQIFLRFDQENPDNNIQMMADEMVITDELMDRHHTAHIRKRQEIKHAAFTATLKKLLSSAS